MLHVRPRWHYLCLLTFFVLLLFFCTLTVFVDASEIIVHSWSESVPNLYLEGPYTLESSRPPNLSRYLDDFFALCMFVVKRNADCLCIMHECMHAGVHILRPPQYEP